MKQSKAARIDFGNYGERAAADFLQSKGLKILAQNFRSHPYEIDLIAKEKCVLVFVEVRVRRVSPLVPAEQSLGPKKRRSLRRGASAYLRAYPGDYAELRFDLLANNGGNWQWLRGIAC